MKESQFESIIPAERSLEEVTSETWREFVYNLKKIPPHLGLTAVTLLAMTQGMLQKDTHSSNNAPKFHAESPKLDGHSLEDPDQRVEMEQIIMKEMSPRFAEERQSFIDIISQQFDAFAKKNSLENSTEVYPIEEFYEWLHGKVIGRQDIVQIEKDPEKGSNEFTTYFEYLAQIEGITDGSKPEYFDWQQHASILKVEKPKDEKAYDIRPKGEPFEITGVGTTEAAALLNARYKAVMKIGGKSETIRVPKRKLVENVSDTDDERGEDDIERIYVKKEGIAFIISREVINKTEIKNNRGETGIIVTIKVKPGSITKKQPNTA